MNVFKKLIHILHAYTFFNFGVRILKKTVRKMFVYSMSLEEVRDRTCGVAGEVLQEGDTVMVADGGVGGCSANGYSGSRGQAHTVRLDLKLIADVAFVGFPNAGKSTLLSRLSRASPKIASYPCKFLLCLL